MLRHREVEKVRNTVGQLSGEIEALKQQAIELRKVDVSKAKKQLDTIQRMDYGTIKEKKVQLSRLEWEKYYRKELELPDGLLTA